MASRPLIRAGSHARQVLLPTATAIIFVDQQRLDPSLVWSLKQSGFDCRAPAGRGDVTAVVEAIHMPGLLVLVDGVEAPALPVPHAELRAAVAAGWTLWGIAGIGAIRAREMAALGVRGFGVIYEHFLAGPDFHDDEIMPPHASTTADGNPRVPLVELRHELRALECERRLNCAAAVHVIRSLKRLWYGHRTVRLACSLLGSRCNPAVASELRQRITAKAFCHDRRATDLRAFLRHAPWVNEYSAVARPAPYFEETHALS